MQVIRHKAVATLYWVVAFLGTVAGAVFGAHLGNGGAPEFGDSTTGASAGSHLLFALGGGFVGGLLVLALFSGVWMALWAAQRRAQPTTEDHTEYGTLDDLDEEFDAAESRAAADDEDDPDEMPAEYEAHDASRMR